VDTLQGNERKVIGVDPQSSQDFRDVGKKVKEIEGIDKLSFGLIENAERKDLEITKGNSEWEGWGTALKPACEPIVVARKSLSEKNVALNVLKWGTGGINIDECRVGTSDLIQAQTGHKGQPFGSREHKFTPREYQTQGRFPANVILDEEAGKMLDEQAPETGAFAKVKKGQKSWGGEIYHKFETGGDDGKTFYDEGKRQGASRFFYCAKASKGERNYGCDELDEKNVRYEDGTAKSLEIFSNQYTENSENPTDRGKTPKHRNIHPTVKPIKLMEYLIKLVSRKNSIILDPFLGSGTTAIACLKLGRKFIGIEKEEEYVKIARARIKPYFEQEKLNQK